MGKIAAACRAFVMAGSAACAGGLEDPQRFQQTDPVVTSGPSSVPGVDDATQMLPLLPATPGVDPQIPTLTPDAGTSAIGGTGGAPIAPPGGSPPPPACVVDVLAGRCAGLECHGPGALEVDLISPGVIARLVNRPSSPNLLCAGRTYIATDGSPSLLLDKLRSAPPCGSRMPLKGNLGAQQVDCLVDWVASRQVPPDLDAGAP